MNPISTLLSVSSCHWLKTPSGLFQLNTDKNQTWFPHQLIVPLLTRVPTRNLVSAFFKINGHSCSHSFNKFISTFIEYLLCAGCYSYYEQERQTQSSRLLQYDGEVHFCPFLLYGVEQPKTAFLPPARMLILLPLD